MSQPFLNQLLVNPENRVQSEKGEKCIICLEEYQTLNPTTGTIECEIRLPCNHGIGSSCLVNWLHTGNNCPVCRADFFGVEPRQRTRNGIAIVNRPITAPPARNRPAVEVEPASHSRIVATRATGVGARLEAIRDSRYTAIFVRVFLDFCKEILIDFILESLRGCVTSDPESCGETEDISPSSVTATPTRTVS